MGTINELAKKVNFSTKKKLERNLNFHFQEFSIKPSLEALSLNQAYQRRNLCYNASIYEYIFVTLINIQKYLEQLRTGHISKLEIVILTTQIPSSFENGVNSGINPYYRHSIMIDYMALFNELTSSHKNIKVRRYYICDEKQPNIKNEPQDERIKFFYNENDLQKCFCLKGKHDQECNGICKENKEPSNKEPICKGNRHEFFSKNTNALYFYLPLCACGDNRSANKEIRELISFRVDKVWDLVITSNLIDSVSNLFLKFYSRNDLNDSKFNFLGIEEKSFVDFIDSIENNVQIKELDSFWGIDLNNKKKKKKNEEKYGM